MTSSSFRTEDGFATPAAAGVCLAISIMVTAVMLRSTGELRRARADLERTRAEYALEGAAASAELTILESRRSDRYAWTLTNELGTFEVLAEAEARKLGRENVRVLEGSVLGALGVTDPVHLEASLSDQAARKGRAGEIAAADPSSLWRACGRSLVSPWGNAPRVYPLRSVQPELAGDVERLGEVWRIRTRSAQGFTDDRVVRFTGDPQHPAAVIERSFYRSSGKGVTCDSLVDAKTAG